MAPPGVTRAAPLFRLITAIAVTAAVAGCMPEQIGGAEDSPFAPSADLSAQPEDGLVVGNRLMAAGEYELALDAFTRAALDQGMTADVLTGIGSADLGLGRLGQAEQMLRRAVEAAPDWPEAWNNLGVVLMERGKTAEASEIFRRAYALDNGESDAIRDNLRLALAKMENPVNNDVQKQEYKLVRRGSSDFLIRKTP